MSHPTPPSPQKFPTQKNLAKGGKSFLFRHSPFFWAGVWTLYTRSYLRMCGGGGGWCFFENAVQKNTLLVFLKVHANFHTCFKLNCSRKNISTIWACIFTCSQKASNGELSVLVWRCELRYRYQQGDRWGAREGRGDSFFPFATVYISPHLMGTEKRRKKKNIRARKKAEAGEENFRFLSRFPK